MPKRGRKSSVFLALTPEQRAELDQAIVDGRQTKSELHQRFAEPHGVGYRAFCKYAAQLESFAKHRYVGRLLAKTYGNLSNPDLDSLARGITIAVLNRIAADLPGDNSLTPRDLRDVVKAWDLLRRGSILDAQEGRHRTEWEALRAVSTAEAVVWIKERLTDTIADDADLKSRLNQLVDQLRKRKDKEGYSSTSARLIEEIASRRNLSDEVVRLAKLVYGSISAIVNRPPTNPTLCRPKRSAKCGRFTV